MYYCDMEAERFLNYKEEFFMMLRFRKMMAVLLAAALTLTMLTACGGGGSGASVDAKVKLTESVNEALKKDGYTEILKYDAELDKTAYLYRVYRENSDVRGINKDWKEKNVNRRLFKVDVLEAKKSDSASKIAEEIKPTLENIKGDDWSIGYYVEPKENNKKEVVSREITIILEWKEVTK
jgi:hypothetical protein